MPIAANIKIKAMPENGYEGFTSSSVKTGVFNIKIAEKGKYILTSEAEGFVTYEEEITLDEVEASKEINKLIKMDPLAPGEKFALKDISFEQSKSELLPQSFPELERLTKLLEEYPKMVIELGGHTDNVGYMTANKKLSQKRADAVKSFLIEKGIPKRRIKSVGYGPTEPLVANNSDENRSQNRRVEVKILEF